MSKEFGASIKPRIEWIDLAKGFCICFVVLFHVADYYGAHYPFSSVFVAFRMPLYFILSGIFFKRYEGLMGFMKRKVNKLLIPYLFFFIVTGILVPLLLYSVCNLKVKAYTPSGLSDLKYVFSEAPNGNAVIWFLWCLFVVNILFYLITMLSDVLLRERRMWGYVSGCLVCGVFGLTLARFQMDLPFFLDSSLTALPFFFIGWLLKNKTSFLYSQSTKSNLPQSILCIVVGVSFIGILGRGHCNFMSNWFGDVYDTIVMYPLGIIGTISVLLVARIFVKIPVLSYYGRYSIILLCTHFYVLQFVDGILRALHISGQYVYVLNTIIVLACYWGIIPFALKYLPYVTAQKDVIKA